MPAQIHTKVFVHFEQGRFGVLKESAKKAPYMDFLYIQLDAIKKRWYCMNDINGACTSFFIYQATSHS